MLSSRVVISSVQTSVAVLTSFCSSLAFPQKGAFHTPPLLMLLPFPGFYFSFFLDLLLFLCTYVCLYVTCLMPTEARKGHLGAGVTGVCEPTSVGVGS